MKKNITENYEKGREEFYVAQKAELKRKYQVIQYQIKNIKGFAEILVKLSKELATEWKNKNHL